MITSRDILLFLFHFVQKYVQTFIFLLMNHLFHRLALSSYLLTVIYIGFFSLFFGIQYSLHSLRSSLDISSDTELHVIVFD